MVSRVQIDEFLALAAAHPVLDVRSPAEYAHAHIPGAYSLPLFTDEERKIVGTAYKQQSRETAIKAGLDFFGPKMRRMVEDTEDILSTRGSTTGKTVLVHCWRGGMRSAGVAWLLDLYGVKVYTLTGGYKSFRQWAMQRFAGNYQFRVIGGYTGSGKTALLHKLASMGERIIDLEGIANHRGSAFGGLGRSAQPSQEHFENTLALALHANAGADYLWIEDESRRIGNVNIPEALWHNMRRHKVYFIDIPATERLGLIAEEYGGFGTGALSATIMRIQKKLGGVAAKQAIEHLQNNDVRECFRILLRYYDKFYTTDLTGRDPNVPVVRIPAATVDIATNAGLLLNALAAPTDNKQ